MFKKENINKYNKIKKELYRFMANNIIKYKIKEIWEMEEIFIKEVIKCEYKRVIFEYINNNFYCCTI